MRLTDQQHNVIRTEVTAVFGSSVQVWLFGSRVDDNKRGGDIDLLIKTNQTDVAEIVRAEVLLQTKLQAKLGEQKIDVLVDYPSRQSYPAVFEVAKQAGILL